MINLASILEDNLRERPDKTAVVFGPVRLSFRQIDAMACQVANGLRKIGVKKGDKVALTCPNLPYFPAIWFGILKVGAVMVPLSVLLRPREIVYHLTDSESVAYICFEGTPELPMGQGGMTALKEVPSCKHFYVIPTAPGGPSPFEGVPTLADLMANQPPTADTEQMEPNDTALIIYTSGTTGRPKGAELTHSNLLMNCVIAARLFESVENDVSLGVLPLFHSFGISILDSNFLQGGTLVLITRFDAGVVLKTFQDEGVTIFAGVPTMYWDLLNYADADKFDLKKIADTLRLGISGGAALPVEVLRQFEEKYGIKILEGYGLSETSPTASFNRADRPRKVGSIGLPIWGVEMKILDDDMKDVPVGKPGEVCIRGHNVMKGYYNKPEANAEAFRGGWFHSGDIGTMDEDGYFYIVDRKKDMVIRGGFNVYPREVEEVLMMHPDISLAAVIGIPHAEYGEEVKAYIVPKAGKTPDPAEIIKWAKQEMAAYKYPRMVEVVDSLPLGPSGKILKLELRKMDADKRGA